MFFSKDIESLLKPRKFFGDLTKQEILSTPRTPFTNEGSSLHFKFVLNGKLHRSNGPAYILCSKKLHLIEYVYIIHSKVHREHGPSSVHYKNGRISSVSYHQNNVYHRENGYARIKFNENHQMMLVERSLKGKKIYRKEFFDGYYELEN